jgi:hypothetical protein
MLPIFEEKKGNIQWALTPLRAQYPLYDINSCVISASPSSLFASTVNGHMKQDKP